MTWFEWTLVGWLILAALLGWRAGFIFTAGNLLGFFGSLWVAAHYGSTVAGWVGNGPWGSVLSSLGIVMVITKLGGLIALLIDKVAKISFIIPFVKTFNRLAGIILSVVTHGLAASLIAFLVHTIVLEKMITQWWAYWLVNIGGLLAGILPNTVQRFL